MYTYCYKRKHIEQMKTLLNGLCKFCQIRQMDYRKINKDSKLKENKLMTKETHSAPRPH